MIGAFDNVLHSKYSLSVYNKDVSSATLPQSIPKSISISKRAVDVAIVTLSRLIPLQDSHVQGITLDNLITFSSNQASSTGGDKGGGNTTSKIHRNVACTLLSVCRSLYLIHREVDPLPWMHNTREYIVELLLSQSPTISIKLKRCLSEALGSLSAISGTDFIRGKFKTLAKDMGMDGSLSNILYFYFPKRCRP